MEKTCGNCGNAIPIPIEEEDGTMRYDMISVCPDDWCIDLIRNEPNFVGHTPDTEPCEEWIEQKELSLEQRYQQLAKVAKEMITALEVAYIAIGTSREWNSCVIKGYKKRLEELGVEL